MIHELANVRWHVEKWISDKEMKPIQKVMKFRTSVEILNTWISGKEMASYYEFPNFRWLPENINMNFR